MTTTRLDRVLQNQRQLMVFNIAAIVAFVSSAAASLLSFV